MYGDPAPQVFCHQGEERSEQREQQSSQQGEPSRVEARVRCGKQHETANGERPVGAGLTIGRIDVVSSREPGVAHDDPADAVADQDDVGIRAAFVRGGLPPGRRHDPSAGREISEMPPAAPGPLVVLPVLVVPPRSEVLEQRSRSGCEPSGVELIDGT